MSRIVVFRRKQLVLFTGICVLVVAALFYLYRGDEAKSVAATTKVGGARTIHMVTGEFATKLPDGKEIEAYRWDPGTIFVEKGERIKLSIYGVNGDIHPFVIEGLNIKGEVKKGEETVVEFKADKEGVYRIICLSHPDMAHEGPMIGYIVVD
jgi:heme/copper-type cytochrome/quinol oxidase subunit 2